MRKLYTTILLLGVFFLSVNIFKARAETLPSMLTSCQGRDLKCILDYTAMHLNAIKEDNWRDQIIRDLVMRYADSGYKDEAIALIPKVQNPDTKAMSIRAAGFGLAKYSHQESHATDRAYFTRLDELANTIKHDGARAIAFTYIAMGEALAGLDEDATQTALDMKNSALRNKALGESAEIQSERSDLVAAQKSIAHIDDAAFRDKAYTTTAEIFIKQGQYDNALAMAEKIQNAYKKNKVILDMAAVQINATEASRHNEAHRK